MLLGAPYLQNYATRTRQAASRDSVTPLQFNTNAGRLRWHTSLSSQSHRTDTADCTAPARSERPEL